MDRFHYDRFILFSVLALLAFGLLMVASSSMVISDRQYGYPFHYMIRQGIYLVLGVALAFAATRLSMQFWRNISGYLIIAAIVLLVVVLIPGIGRVVNGSRRWLNLGVLTLQVSELAKLFMVLYMARFLQRFEQEVQTQWGGFLRPMILLAVIGFLLLLEPDFGTAAVLTMTCMIMLFVAGVRLTPFIILFVVVALAMTALAIMSPYRLERLTTFLNPWSTAFGSGYQLTQSLIAFGRGGVFGVGLGNSIQKLFYLPEAHTDFLFAVIAEELGLMGELLVIGLFSVFVVRVMYLANKAYVAKQLFQSFFAYGAGSWLAIQAMINVGVNSGLLPTKGLTLPFLSYGGSSMLVNCLVVGILLRLSFELNHVQANESSRHGPYIGRFL